MGRRRRHRHHERTSERLGLLAAALDYWPSRRMPIAMRLALAVVIGNAFVLAGVLLVDAKPRVAEPPSAPPAKMVVEAKELAYDETRNSVSATGNVKIFYKGRTLEADRVVYDRGSQRVYAEGHARLTETDGTVVYADRFDLTDDFKAGFMDSLRVEGADNAHFSAPRAERSGETTTFDLGTYTACDACRDDPSKPRLWSVRAKRIIHDNDEKVIYYEDASLELLGVPIAYMPYFSSPDPSVKRKSGFLNPQLTYRSQIGYSVAMPYYWALAPNYDLTVTPTGFTRQGPFLSAQFRHRVENGGYSINVEGTHVGDPSAFATAPYGARDKRWRGAVQSNGEFQINDQWRFGWDVTALSDRYFLQDYKQYNSLYQNYFFRESSSTIYLTGQGPRSFFDLRGFYFQGLSPNDVQAQQPVVHPLVDYNRAFDVDPERSFGIGGQLDVDANFTSTSASIANYESIQPRTLDSVYGLYNVCQNYAPSADPYQSRCLLRGVGGNYEHATVMGSWKRKAIDPVGGVWTPFVFARFSGSYLDYDTSNYYAAYNAASQPIPNSAQSLFFYGADNAFRGQATPGGGVEWRYPILARGALGDLVVEPIAQIVARPNQSSIPSLVNMDAQSLVFDDSNLFEWSKYSGYDRFETGTRANYGGQATLTFGNGGFVNALVGQSRQIAGKNGYSTADAANVGLSSGLDTRTSDWVGRFAFAPSSMLSFVAKGRFDPDGLRGRRIDLIGSLNLDPLNLTFQYANYASQPVIGFDQRRQGLAATGRYDLTENYFLNGSVTFDMSRYLYNSLTRAPAVTTTLTGANVTGSAPLFSLAALGLGAGYKDECTTVAINYSSVYQAQASTGLPARNQTIMVSLQLRTLGDAKFNYGLGSILLKDGVRSQP
ncbi:MULTISPECIES: LPS-assembly protein LptD [Methylosinus]|uniref:LPS-assembly protein LptD n=2 Tax=Methylosinus trichosporium TaxID=426 RepID=A0A2D2CX45_METT3|nr:MULTISPECIES: LPS-assembly protein LptD [Methylosinus]ATQ67328.1 LPS-assembly protein LptD [Methylosinus trichosporium OB3b]